MIVLKPDYYDDFKCTGDKCPFTCCFGWRVAIDQNTYSKYKKLDSDYGKYIVSTIENDDKYGACFKMDEKGRCPHLSDDNLCNIYSNISEDYMCDTCKKYPRNVAKYNGDVYEYDLVASCPEVARILTQRKNSIEYQMSECNIEDLYQNSIILINGDYDDDYYNFIFEVRSSIIDILQIKEINSYEKCMMLSAFSENVQNVIKEYNNWDKKLEAIKAAVLSEEFIKVIQSSKEYVIINKVKYLKFLLESEVDLESYVFIKPITDYVNRLAHYSVDEDYKNEMEFSTYLEKEYSDSLENYMVYLSFRQIRKVLQHNNINIEIMFVIMSLVVIQTLLYNIWIENDKKIKEEKFEKVIYTYSRFMEHNESRLYNLLAKFKDENLNLYDLAKMVL